MVPTQQALEEQITDLESTLSALKMQRQEAEAKLKNSTNAAATAKRHIQLIHDYNEIRDVALNFAGKIAEKERCRTIDVLKEYDINEKD